MDQYIANINLESANQELYIKLAKANAYKNAYNDLINDLEKLSINNQIDSLTVNNIITVINNKYKIG